MVQKLVTVVVPAYNVERYVADAVRSVLGQTYGNWELIIVDDGSKDGTRLVIEPFLKDVRIRYVHQDNKGLSGARNTGIRAARGEYIALLDADDLFLPEKMEKQLKFLDSHPECDVCYCDIYHFYDDRPDMNLKLDYEYYSGKDVFPNLLKKNFINPLAVFLRGSVFQKAGYFNEKFRRSEDWEFWIRASYKGVRFCFFPEKCARYRMRKGSLSYGWAVKADEKKTVLQIFENLWAIMTPEDREKYHMRKIIFRHKLRLWYIYAGDRFPFFQWFYQWIQKKRLRSV